MSQSVLDLVSEYARLCRVLECPSYPRVCWELGAVSSDTATKRGPVCPDLGSMKCSASLVPIILVCQSGLSTPFAREKETIPEAEASKEALSQDRH